MCAANPAAGLPIPEEFLETLSAEELGACPASDQQPWPDGSQLHVLVQVEPAACLLAHPIEPGCHAHPSMVVILTSLMQPQLFSCNAANLEAEEVLTAKLYEVRQSRLYAAQRAAVLTRWGVWLQRAAAASDCMLCCACPAQQVAATVNVSHPWATPGAEQLDSITFSSWCVNSG